MQFLDAAWEQKVMIGGVCRKGMRGFPPEFSIAEPSGAGATQKLKDIKGTVKAAVRLGSVSGCPSMIAVCFYDSKPVHYLTTIDGYVQWTRKTRRVHTLRAGLFDLSKTRLRCVYG